MTEPKPPAIYEIRVEGALDARWTAWFDGLQVTSDGGQTTIRGPLPDQSALHGVLVKIRDLGLCLVFVHRLETGETEPGAGPH